MFEGKSMDSTKKAGARAFAPLRLSSSAMYPLEKPLFVSISTPLFYLSAFAYFRSLARATHPFEIGQRTL